MRQYFFIALAAFGCGRVGFEGHTDANDAVMATRSVPCPLADTAPDPVEIRGETFRYTSFNNTTATVGGASVAAWIGGADKAQVQSTGAGAYTLAVPTGGQPAAVTLVGAAAGYYTTWFYSDQPVDAPVMGNRGAILTWGDMPLWDAGAMGAVYTEGGASLSDTLGTLNVAVRDCDGQSIPGVTVTITPAPGKQFYQASDGSAGNTSSTVAPFTHAIALRAVPGLTHIAASGPGIEFREIDVPVQAGMNNTIVVIHAVR